MPTAAKRPVERMVRHRCLVGAGNRVYLLATAEAEWGADMALLDCVVAGNDLDDFSVELLCGASLVCVAMGGVDCRPNHPPASAPVTPINAAPTAHHRLFLAMLVACVSAAAASRAPRLYCSFNWCEIIRRCHSRSASIFLASSASLACQSASSISVFLCKSLGWMPRLPSRKFSFGVDSGSFMAVQMSIVGSSHAAAGSVRVFEPGASRAIYRRWSGHDGCSAMPNV